MHIPNYLISTFPLLFAIQLLLFAFRERLLINKYKLFIPFLLFLAMHLPTSLLRDFLPRSKLKLFMQPV